MIDLIHDYGTTITELPGVELKGLELIHPFLWAGNATFTLVSKVSGKRFTYKLVKSDNDWHKDKQIYFVSYLNGPDNEHNYQYLGMLNLDEQSFKLTKNSKVTANAPCVVAFTWFIKMLFADPDKLLAQAEIWHEGKCGRCGRKLTVPESIANGIGPDCLAKMESGE